ncbi:MAG: HAMP domain-containing histidine kinase [Candidatus Obscuribacterales bacterium]|nr:HAMP domain-containing histidine kinase [Candidatus Obscuribacterales bacterium]
MPWIPRLSLLQKLLLFILIPIGLETAFLSGALWLFHQSELEVKQEARLNAVSNLLEQLVHSLYAAGSDIIAAATLGPEVSEKSFIRHTTKARDCLNELRKATSGNEAEREVVNKLSKSCQDTLRILKQSHDAATEGPQGLMFMKGHRLTRQIEKNTKETIEQVTQLKDLEEQRKEKVPRTKAQTKQQLQSLLCFATLANIVFGIFLAIFLTRNLTSRLTVIIKNTEKIARGEELLERVGGRDELTKLDESIHHAAELLKSAEKKQKELEQSRKQFVAMLGHDLKNPLHFLQLSLDALKQKQIEASSQSGLERIGQCAEEVERLVNLSNDLIWAARSDADSFDLKLEKTLLWTIFDRATRAVESLAESRNIIIESEADEDLSLEVDRDRMIQVLVNLLSNAIQASPKASKILLKAQQVNNELFIDVIDNGKGIPEAAIGHIFERFYRVDENGKEPGYEGIGLGLAICQAIVKAHHGQIAASNRSQGGCQFQIVLPLSASRLSELK